MASINKRGNSYLIRASCGFDVKGKRITKCLAWIPPLKSWKAECKKLTVEKTRHPVFFYRVCTNCEQIR